MRGVNVNDVYYSAIRTLRSLPQINSVTTSPGSLLCLHHKLGHHSIKVLKQLFQSLKLESPNMSTSSFHCDACLINKSHKLPLGSNSFTVSKPLEFVYSDVSVLFKSPLMAMSTMSFLLIFTPSTNGSIR